MHLYTGSLLDFYSKTSDPLPSTMFESLYQPLHKEEGSGNTAIPVLCPRPEFGHDQSDCGLARTLLLYEHKIFVVVVVVSKRRVPDS